MQIIRIKNLLLRTIIGINDWERINKQDITLNISLQIDASSASKSDSIDDTVDYKKLTKQIINSVEESSFFLLERLTEHVIDIIMTYDKVLSTTVQIDKPHALRFAQSVSFQSSRKRTS